MPNQTPEKKGDQMPVDLVEYALPDGQVAMLPTSVVAMLEKLQQLEAQMAPQAPVEGEADAPNPPLAPAGSAAAAPPAAAEEEEDRAPSPAEAAVAPQLAPQVPQLPSRDAVRELVRSRARLERLASSVGVPAQGAAITLDSDDDSLARAFVAAKMPFARADSLSGEALSALVDAAAAMPAETENNSVEPVNPWNSPKPTRMDAEDEVDPVEAAQARFLQSHGYAQ